MQTTNVTCVNDYLPVLAHGRSWSQQGLNVSEYCQLSLTYSAATQALAESKKVWLDGAQSGTFDDDYFYYSGETGTFTVN